MALAAAFVTWLVVDRTSDGSSPAPTSAATEAASKAAPTPPVIQPRIVSLDDLTRLADSTRTPLYWAGPRAGSRYELTRTGSGTVYLRYLPLGRLAGDRKPALTIVTYPIADALHAVEVAAREAGTVRLALPGGGLAVVQRSRLTNIHLAYPGQAAQIEVYAPQSGVARRLVLSGAVRPLS